MIFRMATCHPDKNDLSLDDHHRDEVHCLRSVLGLPLTAKRKNFFMRISLDDLGQRDRQTDGNADKGDNAQ